jgi:capsid protein
MPELPPGQEIQMYDPTFPTQNYGDFVVAVLRALARGLKVSYLTLTGDLRQANYSSMRAGLLPERDHWRRSRSGSPRTSIASCIATGSTSRR